jgi:hypothetical protein
MNAKFEPPLSFNLFGVGILRMIQQCAGCGENAKNHIARKAKLAIKVLL